MLHPRKTPVVWITGASSGIGAALVKQYAKKEYNLVVSSRSKAVLQQIIDDIPYDLNRVLVLDFDLNESHSYNDYINTIIQRFGRLDILFLNGGISQRSKALETTEEVERKLMQINYFAQVAMAKAVLPLMQTQGEGRIVVISSIAGKFGFYLRSTYAAAKHALFGYFESLRLETERFGIKIHIVYPGKIKTQVSVHALGADGNPHRKMDPSHQNAMSAEACAVSIIRQLESGKTDFFVGGKEGWILVIKRFFPSWFESIIRKQTPY
jgi:dehydrogenase/reductase SDR family protein 7B